MKLESTVENVKYIAIGREITRIKHHKTPLTRTDYNFDALEKKVLFCDF